MSLREIRLKCAYDSGDDDLVRGFYVPVLSEAVRYDRVAGFFSSSSLAVAAKGIAKLIENKSRMRLVTCQHFSNADVAAITTATMTPEEVLAKNFAAEYNSLEEGIQKDHIAALGWMLASGLLEIRIALVKNHDGRICSASEIDQQSIMHQKVGIIYDDEFNAISFSGSNNESASGWISNVEEFKVFKQWEPGQQEFFESDVDKFRKFWKNEKARVETIDLPTALRDEMLKTSKDFDIERVAVSRYYAASESHAPKREKEPLNLFFYQQEAVDQWNQNGRRILLEMATGCGKTRTAIACMQLAFQDGEKTLCVIACPETTLAGQWQLDIDGLETSLDKSLFIDGSVSNWRTKLEKSVNRLRAGGSKNLTVFVTHDICSKEEFATVIRSCHPRVKTMLVGDEVHGLGAPQRQRGLLPEYDYRVGLSATPQRWFDDRGTKVISEYFGEDSYVFSIEDALSINNPITNKPFLVQYEYHPRFVQLTDEELEEYKKLSLQIARMSGKSDQDEIAEKLDFLRFKRADIEKSAEEKYGELERLLDEIGEDISDTIIFVSSEQLQRVLAILRSRSISAHRFTKDEGKVREEKYGNLTERQYLISKFKSGEYQVLVAIKCLDEGIDIPSARRAIIMASSTNPREYVQRIGRVIRQAPGKSRAYIYDMIIRPDMTGFGDESFCKLERRIFLKEMDRVVDLSENAINNAEVYEKMCAIRRQK